MKTKDFDYNLPEELIAQHPMQKRDNCRLMVVDRKTGTIKHDYFYNIANYLKKGDLLIINDSRVIPARLFGNDLNGSKLEILLLKQTEKDVWECLVKPGKRAKIGRKFQFGNRINGTVREIYPDGVRLIEFVYDGDFYDILDRVGYMPLPPYIKEKPEDKESYQTVYSKHIGSVAAPTAGLHFTEELLASLKNRGINIAKVTLHVGIGTFKPVKTVNIEDHVIHKEYFEIPDSTVDIIKKTKENNGRVVAVGTTGCRSLEGAFQKYGGLAPCKTYTDIFIYPGFKFKVTDGLITNFHLPKSSLIMLVGAFLGIQNTKTAYCEAIAKRYRFFSFGDAMLIL